MTKKEDREKRIDARCDALVRVLKAIRPIYLKFSKYEQGLIETMTGAAIWYIPKPLDAWTGMISFEALRSFHPDNPNSPKLSEEHVFPRKMAGKKLLNDKSLTFKKLRKLFREKYGKLHYITPIENKMLVRFQKTYASSNSAYEKTGIRLIKISRLQLEQIRRRNKKMITGLCKNYKN